MFRKNTTGSEVSIFMIGDTKTFVFSIAEGGFACLVAILVVSDPRSIFLTVNVVNVSLKKVLGVKRLR